MSGDNQGLAASNEVAETGLINESGEALTEQVSDNYFERVNAEFERRLLMGEISDNNVSETINEIREREASREGFGGIVMDFFRNPAQALKWLATPMIAPIFAGWAGQLNRVREGYETARDRVVDTIDRTVDQVGDGIDAVQERADVAIDAVRQHPFMTGISAALAGFGGIAIFSRLPINFESLRNASTPPSLLLRTAPLMLGGLLRLGRLGVAGFGLFKLYEYLEENPELLGNMPERAEEMREWIVTRFEELGLPEMTDEAIEYISLILTGQKTPAEIWEETGGAAIEAADEWRESNEDIEGRISINEFLDEREEALREFFDDTLTEVEILYQENRALVHTLGALSIITGTGTSLVTVPLSAFAQLSRISLSFIGAHAFGFSALMTSFLATAYYLRNVDFIPESREELKSMIMESIRSGETALNDHIDVNVPEDQIEAALDYALGIRSLSELLYEIEDFIDAAVDASIDAVDLDAAERVRAQNDLGFRSLRSRLRRYIDDEETREAANTVLDSFRVKLLSEEGITVEDIELLNEQMAEFNVRIFRDGDFYKWAIYEGDRILESNNFAIAPELDEADRYDAANDFFIVDDRNGVLSAFNIAGTVVNPIQQDFREFVGRYLDGDEVPADNPKEWLSNVLTRLIHQDNAFITISAAGSLAALEYAGEKYVIGPMSLVGSVIEELIDGDGDAFDLQYTLHEYADGLAPVLIFGTIANMVKARSLNVANAFGRAAISPISVPINYLRFMVDGLFRRRFNSGVVESVTRNVGRIPFVNSQRITDAYNRAFRLRSRYDAQYQLRARSHSYFQTNRGARTALAGLLNTDVQLKNADGRPYTFNELNDMLRNQNGLAEIKEQVRQEVRSEVQRQRSADAGTSRSADADTNRAPELEVDSSRPVANEDVVDRRPAYEQAAEVNRSSSRSRAEADMHIHTHAPDAPRLRGALDGGGGRGRTLGTVLGVGAAAGAGAVLNHLNNDDDSEAPSSSEEEPETNEDQSVDVLSESTEEVEALDPGLEARYMLLPYSEPYYEIDDLLKPDTIRDLNGDQFFIYVEMYKQIHLEQVDATLAFVRENEDFYLNYFRSADERKLNIGNYMELEYNTEDDRLELNYSSASRFRNNLWDSYDQIRIFDQAYDLAGTSEDERPHQMMYDLRESLYDQVNEINSSNMSDEEKTNAIREASEQAFAEMNRINTMVTAAYTGGNLTTYMTPYLGEARDLYDAGNAAARGQFGRFAESSVSFLAGAFTLGAARAVTGTGRAGRLVTKIVETVTRNADNTANSMRMLRGIQRYSDYTRVGLLAFDAFRFTYAPVSINKTEII